MWVLNIIKRIIIKVIFLPATSFIAATAHPKNPISKFVFKNNGALFYKILGDFPYYQKYSFKQKCVEAISIHQDDIPPEREYPTNDQQKKLLEEIDISGISTSLPKVVNEGDIKEVNSYFSSQYYYDSHIPFDDKMRSMDEKPSQAYKSYDLIQQLNCKPILDLCLNDFVVSTAKQYLGPQAMIYGLNTFHTLPDGKAFTHGFHRDVDDIKFLVFFVFWTPVKDNDGAFQQILGTHRETNVLRDTLSRKNPTGLSKNPLTFIKQTIGYGADRKLEQIFGEEEIRTVSGQPGTICAADTFGIHRGTPCLSPRLVTWIRFGASGLRPSAQTGLVKSRGIQNSEKELKAKILSHPNGNILKGMLSRSGF